LFGYRGEVGDIRHDDGRAFAAAFKHDAFEVGFCRIFEKIASDFARSGEAHHIDIVVQADGAPGFMTQAGDDVEHAIGDACFGGEGGQADKRERGLFGGLEDQRVAARECGGEFPRGDEQREIPRDDRANHTDGFAHEHGDDIVRGGGHLVVEFVGGLGVPAQGFDGVGEVGPLGIGDGFAAVQGFDEGEFFAVAFDQVSEAEQDLFALARGHAGPVTGLECGAGGVDGAVDVFCVA